jgi:hypothetical protein
VGAGCRPVPGLPCDRGGGDLLIPSPDDGIPVSKTGSPEAGLINQIVRYRQGFAKLYESSF